MFNAWTDNAGARRGWRNLWLSLLFVLGTGTAQAAAELADPTLPLDRRGQSRPEVQLHLNSVLIASGRRLAVINGRQVSENDHVAGARVQRILPNRVIVYRDGRTWELRLHAGTVRR